MLDSSLGLQLISHLLYLVLHVSDALSLRFNDTLLFCYAFLQTHRCFLLSLEGFREGGFSLANRLCFSFTLHQLNFQSYVISL